jgi:hypothetical protein
MVDRRVVRALRAPLLSNGFIPLELGFCVLAEELPIHPVDGEGMSIVYECSA